mmetsp:Transcript_13301/g.20790  ORF Transcript_13301/g.20790 Transcript_13301/m.20790 type:complete len:113 (-) Transcript_13301:103-441(-)
MPSLKGLVTFIIDMLDCLDGTLPEQQKADVMTMVEAIQGHVACLLEGVEDLKYSSEECVKQMEDSRKKMVATHSMLRDITKEATSTPKKPINAPSFSGGRFQSDALLFQRPS